MPKTNYYLLIIIVALVFISCGDSIKDFEWCLVPAGDFIYGENAETRTIDYDYEIMKYEVTNAQYVEYLNEALAAGDIKVTSITVEGHYPGNEKWEAGTYEYYDLDDGDKRITYSDGAFKIDSGYVDHPVVEVTWFGAWAFAEHYGYRLPTEEEWEKAARGNTGLEYPWGNTLSGDRANYDGSRDPYEPTTTPVGYYNGTNHEEFQTTDSPSPYGCYDMCGNVWEWTKSFFGSNCVMKGGSWYDISNYLRSWSHFYNEPGNSFNNLGIRCVRVPK